MDRKRLEARLDYYSENIKTLEQVKSNCRKTIEDCEKLIEDINQSIKELKENFLKEE